MAKIDDAAQTVLVVDDSPEIHQLVGARIRSNQVRILSAHDAEEGMKIVSEETPDLILLDLDMPGTDGLTLCQQLKDDSELAHIPVIFLTGTLDVDTKVKAFDLGAVDYVTKPFDAVELKARVRAALRSKRYQDLLASKAQIDALTGLWNRGFLDDRLSEEVAVVQRHGSQIAVAMVDIDRFKAINDNYGHPFGDMVIHGVAEALSDECRGSDVVCRYGGEEFALILRNTTGAGAMLLAERLRARVAGLEFEQGREMVGVTVSLGIAGSDQFDDPEKIDPETLLQAADTALYQAKSGGRNRAELASLD